MINYMHLDRLVDLQGSDCLRGKVVFVRVDTNTTIVDGEARLNARILTAASTISRLSNELGAKLLVGTHNGRPGEPSFVSTGYLFNSLRSQLRRESPRYRDLRYIGHTFTDDTLNEETIKAVARMKIGESILLENLRMLPHEADSLSPEEHAQSPFIRTLIDRCGVQYYVLDAFSVAHRRHRSVVGFPEIPNIAGPALHAELSKLDELRDHFMNGGSPTSVFLLGGTKIQDYFPLIERALRDKLVKRILTGGLLANLCLFAQGKSAGAETSRFLKREDQKGRTVWDFLPRMRELMEEHPDVFVLPVDVSGETQSNGSPRSGIYPVDHVPENFCVFDIGPETIVHYEEVIERAINDLPTGKKLMIYVKGPLGAYDLSERYNKGSQSILHFVINPQFAAKVYTVMGGGDTTAMLKNFQIGEDRIDYISLAGGALIRTLAGETLPGCEALEKSFQRFYGQSEVQRNPQEPAST